MLEGKIMKKYSRLKSNLCSAFVLTLLIVLAICAIDYVKLNISTLSFPITTVFSVAIIFVLCYQRSKLQDENRLWEEHYLHLDVLFDKSVKALKKQGGDKEFEQALEHIKEDSSDAIIKMSICNTLSLPNEKEKE